MDPTNPEHVAAYNQAVEDALRRIKRAEHPRAYSAIELLRQHVQVQEPKPAAPPPPEPAPTQPPGWHEQGTQ